MSVDYPVSSPQVNLPPLVRSLRDGRELASQLLPSSFALNPISDVSDDRSASVHPISPSLVACLDGPPVVLTLLTRSLGRAGC